MKVKRIVASINAGFESFLNKVENHEAVAESAIEEVRDSAAKVKVQQRRVGTTLARLRTRKSELDAEVELHLEALVLGAQRREARVRRRPAPRVQRGFVLGQRLGRFGDARRERGVLRWPGRFRPVQLHAPDPEHR